MTLTNSLFTFTPEEQVEYDKYLTIPFRLRMMIKPMVRDYQESRIDELDILTIIKDLDQRSRQLMSEYVLSLVDVMDPEEDLLDLCELIHPMD